MRLLDVRCSARHIVRSAGTLLAIAIAIAWLRATPAFAATCDLAKHNQNPIAVTPAAFSPLAAAVNRNFSDAAGSMRYYDLVDGLDGVTLGFGNWPQQEVEGFFADMARTNHGVALDSLRACLVAFFRENPGAWQALEAKAGMKPVPVSSDGVAQALAATLLDHRFMARYADHCRRRCKPGEPNLYVEQYAWFKPAMHYAFCDRVVIAWQVDFWSRTIVADALKVANELGFGTDEGAVVAVAAYRSSSPGWLNSVRIAARMNGIIRFNGRQWNWNVVPPGLDSAMWLKRWRLLILWQFYANHVQVAELAAKGKWSFRDRSRLYYRDYLAQWWTLPARDPIGRLDWTSAQNLMPDLVRPAGGRR